MCWIHFIRGHSCQSPTPARNAKLSNPSHMQSLSRWQPSWAQHLLIFYKIFYFSSKQLIKSFERQHTLQNMLSMPTQLITANNAYTKWLISWRLGLRHSEHGRFCDQTISIQRVATHRLHILSITVLELLHRFRKPIHQSVVQHARLHGYLQLFLRIPSNEAQLDTTYNRRFRHKAFNLHICHWEWRTRRKWQNQALHIQLYNTQTKPHQITLPFRGRIRSHPSKGSIDPCETNQISF